MQRLLVFFSLCVMFGAMVWMLGIVDANSRALLAATGASTEPTDTGAALPSNNQQGKPLTNSDKQCPEAGTNQRYNKSKPKYPATYTDGMTQIQNLYGKPCKESMLQQHVLGSCIDANVCKGQEYVGLDKKIHEIDPNQKMTDATKPPVYDTPLPLKQLASLQTNRTDANPLGPYETPLTNSQPANSTPTQPSDVGNKSTPSEAIERIAQSQQSEQGQNLGGQRGSYNSSPFNSSPILSNVGNWGGLSNVGGGGYQPTGGSIAYVPVQQYPGLSSSNFEASREIRFPKPRPSAADILATLAENTRRGGAARSLNLTDRVVDNAVVQAINTIVTPVGEFVRSFFASEEAKFNDANSETSRGQDQRQPLDRGRLVLTLAADDSLVAGDPRQLRVGSPERTYEAFESISESNRAWVQSAPQAGEKIEGIASAQPSYGWGDVSERSRDSGVGAPEVSNATYEPSLAGNILPSIGVKREAAPQRSFFSVIGKSFETIGNAVSNLFANIGKSLFWWL